MAQLFISHAQEDLTLALEVTTGLEESGFSTWLYERDSVPGPSYLLQMGEAIGGADAIVLIISPSSIHSSQVTSEVVRAHEKNKPFFPLLYEMSHAEFQERQPIWRQALGASTSREFTREEIPGIVLRIGINLGRCAADF